jgi:hypothetical protein
MLVAQILLLGSVIATNRIVQTWTNTTSCKGTPSFVTIMSSPLFVARMSFNSSMLAEIPCMSIECACTSGKCETVESCSDDTISTIGSVFGSKSYLQLGKTSSIIMNC